MYFQGLSAEQLAQLIARRDEDERTLLHTACGSGNLQLVQFLADHGAAGQVNDGDEEVGATRLHLSAPDGRASCLPDAHPNLPLPPSLQGWRPLHTATSAGHEPVVRLLISLGADVGTTTAQARTPLHYAASKGHRELVDVLLAHGAQPDAADENKATALHRAASTGRTDVIRQLLAAGARLDARNRDKATPLLLACIAGHQVRVQASSAAGPKPAGLRGSSLFPRISSPCPVPHDAVQSAAILLAAKGADVEVHRGACLAAAEPCAVGLLPSVTALTAAALLPLPQAEEAEGETPLGAAGAHGKLRETLVAVARGELSLDDLMLDE